MPQGNARNAHFVLCYRGFREHAKGTRTLDFRRRRFPAEGKIRLVIEGIRAEVSVADLCRPERIHPTIYYKWLKDFMEAGKSVSGTGCSGLSCGTISRSSSSAACRSDNTSLSLSYFCSRGQVTSADPTYIMYHVGSPSKWGCILKNIGLVVAILLAALSLRAQITYNTPTNVSVINYPATIPCPYNGTGCTAGNGSLTGANYCFNPTDFPNTKICRATDVNTPIVGANSWNTSCDAGSEVNDWNTLNTRFTICQTGNQQHLFGFDPTTRTVTPDASFLIGISSSAYFSYTQPYIMYHVHANGSGNLAIFSYDTTCSGGVSTCNPSPVQVVDLSVECGISSLPYAEQGVTVSADDQTFGIDAGIVSGPSGIYAISWNRTTGCTYWNTQTGHWFINGVDQGTISISDKFTLHNLRLGKGGTWMKVQIESCVATCTASVNNYFWNIGTSTVSPSTSGNGCGHSAIGYAHWVNKCNGTNVNGLFETSLTAVNTQVSLPTAYPSPEQANASHISWANDNSSDTAPYFNLFYTGKAFGATYPWDNEVVAVSTDGSGKIYRMFHNYATQALQFMPMAISQDGKYALWTTDWDGMLGNMDGTDVACTAGTTNCRTDVFVAVLPLNGSSPLAPPTGLTITLN